MVAIKESKIAMSQPPEIGRATFPDSGAGPVRDADPGLGTQDAELIVAVFRTLVLLVALLVPRLLYSSSGVAMWEIWLAALAGVYNIAAAIACVFPNRFGLRRPFIIAMDALLITTWIRLSGQWELFPFYYLVIVVAAMWFRVFGGAIVAIFCNFFFMLMWGIEASDPSIAQPAPFTLQMSRNPFTLELALNCALLFLVGCLVGYIVEIQEQERQRRLEDELLIANYQREIDLSSQLQPLLLDQGLFGNERLTAETSGGNSASEAGQEAAASLRQRLHPSLEIGAAMKSARVLGGGDYFDIIPLENGRTGLAIADVSGKSVRAQARLPLLKYQLRALAPLYSQPELLMQRLNEALIPDLQPELYIALCYIILDPRRRTLAWCNAGHIAPLLLDTESGGLNLKALDTDGPALGMFSGIDYRCRALPWNSNDQILLYTDGLTDAFSYGGSEDGEEQVRLLATRLAHQGETPKLIADELVALASSILDGESKSQSPFARFLPAHSANRTETQHRDDITVVMVRNAT